MSPEMMQITAWFSYRAAEKRASNAKRHGLERQTVGTPLPRSRKSYSSGLNATVRFHG